MEPDSPTVLGWREEIGMVSTGQWHPIGSGGECKPAILPPQIRHLPYRNQRHWHTRIRPVGVIPGDRSAWNPHPVARKIALHEGAQARIARHLRHISNHEH